MPSENQVGNIVYQVEMEVEKLINAQRKVNDRLDGMESKFNSTSKSVNNAEKSFSSLSKVASALVAVLSVQQVAAYADAWTTVNNKLANAIRPNEQLVEVTQRVFDITQATRSSLDATASLYARLERATRQAGTSTADLAKLTTIINQGFVVSGATAQEAENAIIQLSQGLASGALRGEEFNSVNEQGNRMMVALADSLGVGIGELRNMAAQGKLTTDVVVKGLLSQGDAIGKEFAKTTTTISQALQVASNNITQFVGSSSTVKAGVAVFNDAVITLSNNLDMVSAVVLAITAVMGSRFVGALTAATASQIANAAAAYRLAAAQGAVAVASAAARGALSLLGGAGGAATLAATAIFYFYQKTQQARQEALAFADGLEALLSKMTKMSDVQIAAEIAKASQAIRDQEGAIKDQQKVVDALTKDIIGYGESMRIYGESARQAKKMKEAQEELAIETAKLSDMQNRQSRTMSAVGLLQAQLNGQRKEGIELLSRENQQTSISEGLMNKLGTAINFAARAKDNFNSSSLKVERSADADKLLKNLSDENSLLEITDKRQRAIAAARQKAVAAGAKENSNQLRQIEEAAAAQYDLQEAESARNKAERDANAEAKRSESQAESVALKLERMKQSTELATSATENLSREQAILRAQQSLGKGATEENIRLAGEYAAAQWDAARATQAAALIPALGENQSYRTDMQALQAALSTKKITQEEYYTAVEQREQQHQANMAKIISDAAVNPTQQAVAQVDPVQALANENARKLALIQQFETNKTLTQNQAEALRNSTARQYEQQRIAAQWEIWRNQSTANEAMAASFDAFAGNASNALTGLITGSMSASDALRSIGNTVLNSLINTFVQMGVEWVKSAVMGTAATTSGAAAGAAAQTAAVGTVAAVQTGALAAQTTASVAAAGTTAAAWTPAAILSSIASMGTAAAIGLGAVAGVIGANLLGKRKNGGPVSAGGLYQVGEGGMPEIYQASNGKQYMIPGDNGSVISNKDMQGGGQIVVNNNIQNYTNSGVDTQVTQNGNTVSIQTIVYDIANGGQIGQAIATYHNAPRRALA